MTGDLLHRRVETDPDPESSAAVKEQPVRVLYIVGPSRSGSTIIANTLGQLAGCFAVGELWNIWRRGLLERRPCGCGVPVPECRIWSDVLRRTFNGEIPDASEAERLDRLTRSKESTRALGGALAAFGRQLEDDPDDYREVLARLYHAVTEVTGCRVIVDSSKGPEYGLILAGVPNVKVSMVNVVRDPRAVAFSGARSKALPDFGDQRLMRQTPAWIGARRWLRVQAVADSLLRIRVPDYRCVKYEEFSRNPRPVVAELAGLVGETSQLPFEDDHSVRIAPTHSVSGNPSRFKTGSVPIRLDEEWRHGMRRRDVAAVTALTWPLMIRHDYLLLPRTRVRQPAR